MQLFEEKSGSHPSLKIVLPEDGQTILVFVLKRPGILGPIDKARLDHMTCCLHKGPGLSDLSMP